MLFDFRTEFPFWKYFITCFFLTVATVLSHYVLRRWRWSKKLPGAKISIFNLRGDASNFPRNVPEKLSRDRNVFLLQTFRAYARLYRDKTFFTFWMMFVPIIVIVRAQAVEELISGNKNLRKSWTYRWLEPWLGTGLLTSRGQKWKSRRRLLTPTFHFDILKDFLPIFNEQSQILVRKLGEKTQEDWIDILHPVTLCTLDIICETSLGVSINAQRNGKTEFVEAIERVSSITMQRMSNPLYIIDWMFYCSKAGQNFKKDVKLLHDFTRSVIRQKKEALLDGKSTSKTGKRKALMDLLLQLHVVDETLTEEDIREEIDTFTFGGHDTTGVGISWTLYLIGLHKDVQQKIQEELYRIFGDDKERPVTTDDIKDMEYLDRVQKECKRLYPSGPLIGRTSSPGTVLNGYEIPKGTACTLLIYEIHRDPVEFPNPEKFDPDRFLPENVAKRHPFAYIPFSAGPRNCIGQRFGMMEEKVIISNILRTFTVESLEPRDKVIVSPEVVLRPVGPLKIKIRYRED